MYPIHCKWCGVLCGGSLTETQTPTICMHCLKTYKEIREFLNLPRDVFNDLFDDWLTIFNAEQRYWNASSVLLNLQYMLDEPEFWAMRHGLHPKINLDNL